VPVGDPPAELPVTVTTSLSPDPPTVTVGDVGVELMLDEAGVTSKHPSVVVSALGE
jgi:hypothetical protein